MERKSLNVMKMLSAYIVMTTTVTYAEILSLQSGWNLVGADSYLTIGELKTKVASSNLLVVQGQKKTYQKSYVDEGKDFLNSFTAFEKGRGYWIKVNSAVDVVYDKTSYRTEESIELIAGWNLINPPSDLNISEITTQLGSNLEVIQGQNKTYQKAYVDEGKSFLNSFKRFEEPHGYWVKVASDTTLRFSVVNVAPTLVGTAKITTNVYANYHFLPTVTDANGDTLIFSIQNQPSWAEFNTTTGLLEGNPSSNDGGNYTNIIISVNDGTETVSLAPFDIEVKPAINIAHKFGVATQSADSSYQYYEDPANAIDSNLSTMNMTADAGWLQVALPKGSKVAKVVIRNRTDAWSNRLSGTKVYIGTTAFNGTIIEGDYIGTLTDSSAPQILNFETFKEGDYVLLKENDDNLHVLEVEVYGQIPDAPVWKSVNSTLGLKAHASVGIIVGKVEAFDYQSDTLIYSIEGDVPFAVDSNGTITLTQIINYNLKQAYEFTIKVSDGLHETTKSVTVKLLSINGVKQERWNDISGGAVSDFLNHAHYQDTPDETKIVQGLDMNTNLTNNFGQKMTTIFKPEESGTYIFAIVGDDGTELRLDGKTIAYKAGWAGYQDWNTAGKSNKIYLEAGHIYSIDAFLKEGSGGEHISVGIKKNAESDFSLIPENQLFLEVLNSETVKPIFVNGDTILRVSSDLGNGENVGSIIVKDYQDDPISYSIEENDLPFTIDSNGNIHSTGTLENNHTYRFHVRVSDGTSNVSSWVTVVTDKNEKDYYAEMLDYSSEYTITNNMQGDLAGQLWFMQSQMHRPKAKEGEFRPLAVAFRSALLLFMMEDATSIHAMEMKVTNEKGEVYKALLSKPSKLGLCDQSTTDSRAKLTFSKRSWTGEIPWNFMTPKMSIELTELDSSGTEQKSASLNAGEIKLGTPHEIMINSIDLGMLVEPRGANEHVYSKYNKTAEYALNYFQTAPVAKYTVGRYAPAFFPKVVLDDGTVYTDKSASTDAGFYSGDMRWTIAKALVSTGINKANIGLISDKSQDDKHDRIIRQTLLHTAQGKYTDPNTGEAVTVVHGLSGGAGKLTLVDVSGNEFSHEYGHDHGMSHYPGGIYAIHNYESGWSYNTYLNRFIGNLRWKSSAQTVSNTTTEESVAPFKNLYSYGKDSMGQGNPNESLFSKFTFYTPYTAYHIQRNLSFSGMIDDSSLTGYSQWNSEEEKYEPKSVIYPKPTQTKIPVMTLLGFYDPEKSLTTFIYPALYSNYGSYFSSEVLNARTTDDTCKIVVTRGDNIEESYNLLSTRKVSTRMNQFQLNLPLSGNYKKAKVVCDNTELDSRDIVASTFNLKEPVIIGKEYGLKTALKQMRLFSEVFANTNFATNKKFVEAFNTHYASLKSYTDGAKVEEGDSFVFGTKYFIALADNLDAPNEASENWLYLGDSQSYIHLEKLAFGEASENFTERFGSSMYFLVPVDNERVLASNALSGEWYSTNTTQITVQAINKSTGEKQAIVIGGTVRGAPVQGGNNYDVSSVLKFFFKKEDNPTLAKGKYAVSFYTTGRRWHVSDVTLHLLVEGTVVVD